jgi:hypothetical protein
MSNKEILNNLEKAINKLTSLSEAANQRSSWRPIATAPQEGSPILGYKDGIMATVRWLTREKYWTLCVPGSFILYHDWDPKFWMPLPPPPRLKGGDN